MKKKLLFLLLLPTFILPRWLPFRGRVKNALSQRVVNPVVGSFFVIGFLASAFYWWRSHRMVSVLKNHFDEVTTDLKNQLNRIEERLK